MLQETNILVINYIFVIQIVSFMRIKAIIFLIILLQQFIFAQFVNKKTYNISRIKSPPKIDGKLNDIAWQDLNIEKELSQISPNKGKIERKNQKTAVCGCLLNPKLMKIQIFHYLQEI